MLIARWRRRRTEQPIRSGFPILALVLSLLLCTGCYGYAAMEAPAGTVPASAELRVELTPLGASEHAALLGPRAVRVEGSLRSIASDGAIMLVPRTVLSMDGSRTEWSGDAPLHLRQDAIASVAVRRFSRQRTIIAAGTATAAAVAIGVAAVRWGGDKGGGSDNPPPPPPP